MGTPSHPAPHVSAKPRQVPRHASSLAVDLRGAYGLGAPVRSLHRFRFVVNIVDDFGTERTDFCRVGMLIWMKCRKRSLSSWIVEVNEPSRKRGERGG